LAPNEQARSVPIIEKRQKNLSVEFKKMSERKRAKLNNSSFG
jgi:hypothetical protein